jgi:hypothetical protein
MTLMRTLQKNFHIVMPFNAMPSKYQLAGTYTKDRLLRTKQITVSSSIDRASLRCLTSTSSIARASFSLNVNRSASRLFVYKDPNQSFSRTAASLASSNNCMPRLACSLISDISRTCSSSTEAPCSRRRVFDDVKASSSLVSVAMR